jgi:hypothetical protein
MPWFRIYSEARNDAKLRALTDAEFRVWFNLICYASEQEVRGTIQATEPILLAVEVAGGDVALLTATLDKLAKLNVVEMAHGVRFVNWDKRQYDHPSDKPEATRGRKQKQRESRVCHDHVTSCHDTDTDKERERDIRIPPTPLTTQDTLNAIFRDEVGLRPGAGYPPGLVNLEPFMDKPGPDMVRLALRESKAKGNPCLYAERVLMSWGNQGIDTPEKVQQRSRNPTAAAPQPAPGAATEYENLTDKLAERRRRVLAERGEATA